MSQSSKSMIDKSLSRVEEKRKVVASFILSITIILVGLGFNSTIISHFPLHTDPFKEFHAYLGSFARVSFFFAVALYPLILLIKFNKLPLLAKKYFVQVLKYVRLWHVPVALFGMGFVILHIVYAILNGFKVNSTYLSGVFAFIFLLILSLSSLIRVKFFDKKFHRILALVFVASFILHTIFEN